MRIRAGLVIVLISGAAAASALNCADSGDTSSPTGSGSGTTGTGTATTTGTNTGTPGGSATGTATPAGTATGSGGGSATDPCPEVGAPHLLITEIASQGPPGAGGGSVGGNYEFIEIHNPTSSPVDLSKYYLSDNGIYYRIAQGQAFDPQLAYDPETDFLVKFPAGASIPANGYVLIQAGPDFESAWGTSRCPDYAIGTDTSPTCNGNSVTLMEEPTNGSRGSEAGSMLSNNDEMVVLFCWDGTSTIVKDVDYVPWGDASDPAEERVNKTGQPGYQADTAVASQDSAPSYHTTGSGGGLGESLGRCDDTEDNETTTNGNGPAGHDETSEDFSASIEIQSAGTPGAANSCN